jgi:hypothetical protein
MTTMLEQAFRAAAQLPEDEQNLLASRLLAELAQEDEFDKKIARTTDKLSAMAREALAEYRAGLSQPLEMPSQ